MAKRIRFNLEIYLPGSDDEAARIKTNAAFVSIQPGDIINPRYGLFGQQLGDTSQIDGRLLRVVTVEHGFAEVGEEIVQYVRVYTSVEDDGDAARYPN